MVVQAPELARDVVGRTTGGVMRRLSGPARAPRRDGARSPARSSVSCFGWCARPSFQQARGGLGRAASNRRPQWTAGFEHHGPPQTSHATGGIGARPLSR